MADTKDLVIQQGRTFIRLLYWSTEPIVYKAITEADQSAPLRLKVVGHGLTTGWPVAITNVKGMTELNAEANAVKASDYKRVTVIDVDHIEINEINAVGFKPYVSGGVIQYDAPIDLTGCDFRMSVKDKIGGTELFRLSTDNGRILVDEVNRTITLLISAADTAQLTWKKGVYDLEAESAGGIVTLLYKGTVKTEGEVTTTP